MTKGVTEILQPEVSFRDMKEWKFKKGDKIEVSPQSMLMMKQIANIVNISNGCALVIDYGEDQALSDSFRGI